MDWVVILLTLPLVSCLNGVQVTNDVTAYLGVPYAKAPIGELRFKNSELLDLDEARNYDTVKDVCLEWPYSEGSEDCLYLNIYKHKDTKIPLPTLLYVTNQKLSDAKVANLVSSEINVVTASARSGIFGTLDGSQTTSDIKSIFDFLTVNRDKFGVASITLWCEEDLAEGCDAALVNLEGKVARAILINGNQLTRTIGREKFSSIAKSHIITKECNLQCLRKKSTHDLLKLSSSVHQRFFPFGSPFRVEINKKMPKTHVDTIYGVYKTAPRGYSSDSNFTSDFTEDSFDLFLASLIPDSLYTNGALIRRLVKHEYVGSKLSPGNIYSVYSQLNRILIDRDFLTPTWSLAQYLKKKAKIYVLEYGIDSPPKNCLQEGGWDDIEPFCNRILGYYTRFARLGSPAESNCDLQNPSWPHLGSSKRDYFIRLLADGRPDWNFDFHIAALEFWGKLLPQVRKLVVHDEKNVLESSVEIDLDKVLEEKDHDKTPAHQEL